MEIGSFIELQFHSGEEFYKGEDNIARLNSGRAAIWHAIRVLDCKSVWVPYYQCESVRDFLTKKGVDIKYYHINDMFEPMDAQQKDGEAILLVNYYGVMSYQKMEKVATQYCNVIIDNSQAFFAKPLEQCMNVYSCRKFIGVPDGAYVIGNNAHRFINEYEQGYSSDTSLFLLQRIEYGCEGKAYSSRQNNENRIDNEDIMKMSKLTHRILDGADYLEIIERRKVNYAMAKELFDGYNKLNLFNYDDEKTVPMVYPLLIESDDLISKLQGAKHFQGHWWSYVCREVAKDSFEYWISRYLIPITIDQRYGRKELEYVLSIIKQNEGK